MAESDDDARGGEGSRAREVGVGFGREGHHPHDAGWRDDVVEPFDVDGPDEVTSVGAGRVTEERALEVDTEDLGHAGRRVGACRDAAASMPG